MTRAAIAFIAIALALACTALAKADVCPPAGSPWLRVAFAGDGLVAALRARVLEQLGADLHAHGLVLCDSDGTAGSSPAAPLADIALSFSADSILSLEVRDAVTDKRITRELRLGKVPRDALALSIALAAEELLRASWIEAAFAPLASATPTAPTANSTQTPPAANATQTAPTANVTPTAPTANATQTAPTAATAPADRTNPGVRSGLQSVPQAVREVNAEEIARMPQVAEASRSPGAAAQLQAQAALLGVVDHAGGGQTDLGADARFAWGGRLSIGARAGFRIARDVDTAHGVVRGSELLAGLGVAYALVPREAAWGGEVGLRADLLDVHFSGTATAGAQGLSGSAFGLLLSGALGGWVRLGGPWRMLGEAALGAPVHAVTATDTGNAATGVSGLTLTGALGIAATLPN